MNSTIARSIGQSVARGESTLPSCSFVALSCSSDLRSESAFGNAAVFSSKNFTSRRLRRKCAQASANVRSTVEQPYGIPHKPVPALWDVVGLGQAMVTP